MRVAREYEENRGFAVTDVSKRHITLERALLKRGFPVQAPVDSDLLSERGDELRVIEVKGRGGRGPVRISPVQLETFRACGEASWLYVVWNTTQPEPEELWAVQDPARLEWQYCEIPYEVVESAGVRLWIAAAAEQMVPVPDVVAGPAPGAADVAIQLV